MAMTKTMLVLAASAAMLLGAQAAQAAVITLANTGVDALGVAQGNGAAEMNYVLFSAPVGSTLDLRTATSANGFPIGPWLGDDSASTWIGPNSDSQLDGPVGVYDYRVTFSLAGYNPGTAAITGRWSTDDSGTDVLINGVSTGQVAGGFQSWYDFSIASGFHAGTNTIDFLVNNTGGPTGLRVEMGGTADTTAAVPEPASWALMISGFGLAGAALRRRRGTAVAA